MNGEELGEVREFKYTETAFWIRGERKGDLTCRLSEGASLREVEAYPLLPRLDCRGGL